MTNGKIAVTYENGQVFPHFGHTAQFKLYTVRDGKVTAAEILDTNGNGHGALAGWLKAHEVTALICGGIGGGARAALAEAGIELFPGASGDTDEQVAALIDGTLHFDPDTICRHHENSAAHSCGDHGCSEHHHDGHTCAGHCGE